MRFKAKKRYGQSKEASCPFCGKIATQKNEQGLEVCRLHTKEVMEEIRCSCGSWLETCSGKYGPYFRCVNCGNVPYKKGMELKEMMKSLEPKKDNFSTVSKPTYETPKKTPLKTERKEITISTDDVEYFS